MIPRARLVALCRARDRLCDVGTFDVEAVSVAALAEDAGLSTGAFIREFARLFGETPHQRRIRARVERAKQLLAGGQDVTSVCLDVGWSSLGTFSALFRRRVGVPPSVYGRRARGWVQVVGDLDRALAPGCFDLMGAAFSSTGHPSENRDVAPPPHGAISEKRRRTPSGKLRA